MESAREILIEMYRKRIIENYFQSFVASTMIDYKIFSVPNLSIRRVLHMHVEIFGHG